jgi:uncharacterized protein
MVALQWRVRPRIEPPRDGIWIGAGSPKGDGVWLGTLAEVGPAKPPKVWLATDKEQVVAVVGKRGSGKSFTLGVIAEGLATQGETPIGRQSSPRAVLLFDPLDVYWTTRYGAAPSENAEAQRHFELAKKAGITGLKFQVEAWVPGMAACRPADPTWFKTLTLPVPVMGLDEWELLLDVNVMTDPMGQALTDTLALVGKGGYRLRGESVAPSAQFSLGDLRDACRAEEMVETYHPETLRALRQRLGALEATGLFSAEGTPLRDLLSPGCVTVVLLGRLPQAQRSALVAVLTRRLMEERGTSAFAEKRLALDPELKGREKGQVEAAASSGIPRTVVVLDEAQSFLAPGQTSPARTLFVRLVKEGRNMGLSAVLATQQPSALDQRVLSQVETFVAHQLVTEADIRAVRDNLKSESPEAIQLGNRQLELGGLLRELGPGTCLLSAADLNTPVRRSLVMNVRPRATVHGGIEL